MNYTPSRTVSCEMIDIGKYWLQRMQEFRLEMKHIMIVIYNKLKDIRPNVVTTKASEKGVSEPNVP